MSIFLPPRQTFGQEFASKIGEGIGQGIGEEKAFQRQMKLEELKRKKELKLEEANKFQSGLETIQKMKALVEKGNLGRGSKVAGFFGGETAKDRAEYEQLGRSLIPLVAAGVPIRNQQEFLEYKKGVTDPSLPDQALLGNLEALEGMFQKKVGADIFQEETPEEKVRQGKKKIKFDIRNPEHKAKRDQVLKKAKGDREKAQEILSREFEL